MATAQQILKQEFGSSRNIMTPNVLKRGKLHPSVAFELAEGEGLYHQTIWGVTLAGHDGAGQTYRANQTWLRCFSSLPEAQRHLEHVRNLLKGQDARTVASWLTTITLLPGTVPLAALEDLSKK